MNRKLDIDPCYLVIGLSTLAVYVWTMPRTITLEDAGLFQMVCHLGGFGHAPGYPLFAGLCQLVLPHFPQSVLAGNMLSAVFGALACMVFYSCLRQCGLSALAALVAALAYGFGANLWAQATIIEVYTLTVFGYVVCWRLILQWSSGASIHFLYGAALVFGFCLANHWPLTVLSTPALLMALVPAMPRLLDQLQRIRTWVMGAVCLLAGLTPYLLLLQSNPEFALFGPLNSAEEFFAYVSRSIYEGNENHAVATIDDKYQFALWVLNESAFQFGLIGLPLMLAGVVVAFRMRPPIFTLQLLMLYLGSTLALVMLLNISFEHTNRLVFQPWPVLAYLALAMWLGFGVEFVLETFKPIRKLLAVAIVLGVLMTNFPVNNNRENTWVENYGRAILASLPENSIFLVSGDFETGVLAYLHKVQGVRPDLEIRHQWNQFFDNRLASPFDSRESQSAALARYLKSSDRKIFAHTAALYPRKLLGPYYEYTINNPNSVDRNPAMDVSLDYVLDLYTNNAITHPSELGLAYSHLVGFTRQYVALSITQTLTDAELIRLHRLQSTFPGKLATLDILVPQNVAGTKAFLKQTALAARADIPAHVPRRSRAALYEYLGRIALMDEPDERMAISYFELSLQISPLENSESVCPLQGLYEKTGAFDKLSELRKTYGSLADCIAQTSPGT